MVALSVGRKLSGEERLELAEGSEVVLNGGEMKLIIIGWFDVLAPTRRLLVVRVEKPSTLGGWAFFHTALVEVGNWTQARTIPVRFLESVVRKRLAEMD